MLVRTDDEAYRTGFVWLGPPKLTLPWRGRYVGYLVGASVLLVVLTVQRLLGVGLGLLTTAWAVGISVLVARPVCRRITDEEPLRHLARCWWIDLRTPRPARRST